ncbi:hypothetical protein HDU98_004743 [Podochytrium sp. JEL0797]|nr:hypothetical protein HDU98_004743 [Podochytrium sp. JEL0797]
MSLADTVESIRVMLELFLSKNPPLGPLSTGPEAVELVGNPKHSDCILQPNPGEFIQAHSCYLHRNPYFAANLSFVDAQNKDKTVPFKVAPPFPSDFRLLLNCIYAHSIDYCYDSISPQNFVPLLVNAEFFQEDAVIAASVKWLVKNWALVIEAHDFSCRLVDQTTLGKLLDGFGTAETDTRAKLEIILKWTNEWCETESRGDLYRFVESHVDFKKVPTKAWTALLLKYETGVEACIPTRVHHHFVTHPPPFIKVQCDRCKIFVPEHAFFDPGVRCGANTSYNHHSQYIAKFA